MGPTPPGPDATVGSSQGGRPSTRLRRPAGQARPGPATGQEAGTPRPQQSSQHGRGTTTTHPGVVTHTGSETGGSPRKCRGNGWGTRNDYARLGLSFYDRFEHGVYLYVPLEVFLERLRRRTNNPYGATAEQQADIARYVDEVEPLIRRSPTLDFDGLPPIRDLADRVERCLRSLGQAETLHRRNPC